MVDLLKKNIPVNVELYNGYWLDIGRADDYHEAVDLFEKSKKKFI